MKTPKDEVEVTSHDLFAGFDTLRIKEYENLQRLVNLAGSLNRGSGITAKITEMETIADSLRRSDMDAPRRSFMDFLHSAMVDLHSSANETSPSTGATEMKS